MLGQHSVSWATPPACAQSLGVASATWFYSTVPDNSGKCQTNSRLLLMLRHHTERMMGGAAEATIRDGRGG